MLLLSFEQADNFCKVFNKHDYLSKIFNRTCKAWIPDNTGPTFFIHALFWNGYKNQWEYIGIKNTMDELLECITE